jgi:hypothetical protein
MRFSTIIILTALAFSTSVFGETKGQRKTKPKAEPLSKSELLVIGKKYIQAVEACSKPDMVALFLNPEEMEYWADQLKVATVRIWIKGADANDGLVWLQTEGKIFPDPIYYGGEGPKILGGSYADRNSRGIDIYARSYSYIWLMVAPGGKIKYDSLQCKHPLQIAALCVRFLERYFTYYVQRRDGGTDAIIKNRFGKPVSIDKEQFEDVEAVYKQLKESGIPLYGFDLSSSEREYEKSMRQIKKWLIKNGKEWDISEPKVYIPYDLYKQVKKDLLH